MSPCLCGELVTIEIIHEVAYDASLTEFFTSLQEIMAENPGYLARCARCFLKGLCEQCPAKSWMEHGTLDTPVEYLCQVAHAQALDLGLLKEGERSWEVEDWRERVKDFGDRKSSAKSNYRDGSLCWPKAIIGGRNMKKTWTRPELVVLERGSDEERVLVSCKARTTGGGPASAISPCWYRPAPGWCSTCSSAGSS